MLDMLQATFQRVRHACWQSGARFCNCGHCCCGCCGAGNGSSSSGGSSSSSGGGGGGSGNNGSSCGRRRAGLCCSWLSSFLLGWDWIPLATSAPPVAGNGLSPPAAGNQRHASGGVSSRSGGGAGGADVPGLGDAGGIGMRRIGSSGSSGSRGSGDSGGGGSGGGASGGTNGGDDVKPLLTHSSSAELREKERRFIKGRFVVPGSDVQRRIADAMAGVLAAGGRAMTGTDTGGSGGAIGSNRNGNIAGGGGEYRAVSDQDSPTRTSREGSDEPEATDHGSGSVFRGRSSPPRREGSGGTGTPSRRASPRRETPRGEQGLRGRSGGVGMGGGGRGGYDAGREEERECVICMEEFSKGNPEMLTLCSCGVNKTFFHYSCLLQWLAKHSYCPACRGYLFFEERRPGNTPTAAAGRTETVGVGGGGGGNSSSSSSSSSSGRVGACLSSGSMGVSASSSSSSSSSAAAVAAASGRGSAALSSDDYGRAFRRALRAGLGPSLSPRGHGSEANP